MKIVNQSIEFINHIDSKKLLKKLELAGRVCYKSEGNIKEGSKERFLKSIIDRGHESVLEHEIITIKATTDRATANQIVRHRIASYSQESQRYCNYSKGKFDNEITVVKPPKLKEGDIRYNIWKESCESSELAYFNLIKLGLFPEQAREVLPNSTKTEIIITMNIRSWRNFLKLRTDNAAGPNIRELSNIILKEFKKIPVLFDDIN